MENKTQRQEADKKYLKNCLQAIVEFSKAKDEDLYPSYGNSAFQIYAQKMNRSLK